MRRLAYLLRRMEARGVPVRSLLGGTGLARKDLETPGFCASPSQHLAVLRNIVTHSWPGIGLALGLEATIADEGVLGYAALSSATLRDVNVPVKKFHPLVESLLRYSDLVQKGLWHLEFTPLYPMADVLPFLMEGTLARSKVEFKSYTGIPIPFKRVELTYAAPPYAELYEEVLGCPVRFQSSRNQVLINAKYLDLPIAMYNADVARLCEEQCSRLLGTIESSDKVGVEIRRQLILNPGRYPALSEMSSTLRLSASTIKRRLRMEGETYQQILDDTRKQLAIQFLRETELSAKEISHRLGFSNVHNFRRAFKAWTGSYPSHFQR